jgi:hypothetical protein
LSLWVRIIHLISFCVVHKQIYKFTSDAVKFIAKLWLFWSGQYFRWKRYCNNFSGFSRSDLSKSCGESRTEKYFKYISKFARCCFKKEKIEICVTFYQNNALVHKSFISVATIHNIGTTLLLPRCSSCTFSKLKKQFPKRWISDDRDKCVTRGTNKRIF